MNVTLHGQPVNEGDKVWHIRDGFTVVKSTLGSSVDIRSTTLRHIQSYPELYFWQEISPEAIEAAKQKPKEPIYEWQWMYKEKGMFHTTERHYKSIDDFAVGNGAEKLYRIEESKREVKP